MDGADAEGWVLVDSFGGLEMHSKYFKGADDDNPFAQFRYDDGTVSNEPVLEQNAPTPRPAPVAPVAPVPMAIAPVAPVPMAIAPVAPVPMAIAPVAPIRTHLVFDTETTGLFDPHVVQLAYIVFTDDGTEVRRYNKILKLIDGKRIDPRAFEVHRISMSKLQKEGVDPVAELNALIYTCADVLCSGGRVIAHNTQFDVRAVNNTLVAWDGVKNTSSALMTESSTFCTMKQTKAFSPLVDRAGRRKAFRNNELHRHLFGKEPDFGRLHDAMTDILITKANYLECAKRGFF